MESRQADQLAVAIRSPVPAEEDQQRGGVKVIREIPGLPGLIGQLNVEYHPLTLLGSPLVEPSSFFSGPQPLLYDGCNPGFALSVARGRIELPTYGFSDRRSPN